MGKVSFTIVSRLIVFYSFKVVLFLGIEWCRGYGGGGDNRTNLLDSSKLSEIPLEVN